MGAAYLQGPEAARQASDSAFWCVGKERFASAVQAVAVTRRHGRRYPAEHYRCVTCGLWHLGRPAAKHMINGWSD